MVAARGDDAVARALRALASERLGHLLEPGDTWETDDTGCLLMVDVPGVPDGGLLGTTTTSRTTSRSLGRTAPSAATGDVHRWDGFHERDEEALVVRGLMLTDDEAAEGAVSWLAWQLSWPVDHQVSKKVGDRVVAQRWVLADAGREIGRRGNRLARRGSPMVVTRLRPRDA